MSESSAPPDRTLRLLATAGIIGPILFTVVVAILGSLRPGYSHAVNFISELGASGTPNAVYLNITFVVVGSLLVVFSYGLHRGIGGGEGSRVGPFLIGFFGGAGMVGAGIFPGDIADLANPDVTSWALTSVMHQLLGGVGGVAFMAAPFFVWRRLRTEREWEGVASYSLATGILGVLGFLGLALADAGVLGADIQTLFGGAIQRLFLGVLLLWVFVLAVRLPRLGQSSEH